VMCAVRHSVTRMVYRDITCPIVISISNPMMYVSP